MKLEIPDDVLQGMGMTPSLARLEVAVALYRDGKASMGKAAGIAGVPRLQFQQELCSRGVAVNYDVEEYERDLSAIRKLLPS